jgi:hypothetical protein
MRMRRQDLEHVYDGCELDDAETRAKVIEFWIAQCGANNK